MIICRYEESWFLLHKRTKDCAQAAEVRGISVFALLEIYCLSASFVYLNLRGRKTKKPILKLLLCK